MTKNQQRVFLVFIFSSCFIFLVGYTYYELQTNHDARRGLKSILNDIGFNVPKEDNGKPQIGWRKSEVENFCGTPTDKRSYQTARGTSVTITYRLADKPDCEGTFTFVDDKVYSIAR